MQISAGNTLPHPEIDANSSAIELTVVIPCLNEADTIELCVQTALRALAEGNIDGEVLVTDNGSTDGSPQIAERSGARVVHVPARGYGNVLMGGIDAARGKYILMGDADMSYDFGEIGRFLEKLRQGYPLVQGCRLESGGGKVLPGAMPVLHRWIGNPFFSWLFRLMFRTPLHDVNCGMRAFTKEHYRELKQRCTGMEFAVEMVIKSALIKTKIAEVPISLHKDGRKNRGPHLKTFRDGWRTLRYYLLASPRWLFFYPGCALILLGLAGYCVSLPGLQIGKMGFDVSTLLVSSLSILVGYQSILFAVSAKIYSMAEGLLPPQQRFLKLFTIFSLERGLILSAGALFAGFLLLGIASYEWVISGFSALDYRHTLRLVIPASLLIGLGVQTAFSSFFLSIFGMTRSDRR